MLLGYSWIVEDNIFNRLAASEANYIQEKYKETGKVVAPRSHFMTLHKNWHGVPKIVLQRYKVKPSQIEFSLKDGRTLHINIFKLGKTEFVLLADVAGFEVGRDYLPNVIMWLIGISILLALLISTVGYFIANRLTRPIKALADEVSLLSVESSLQTFAARYPNNELRTLAIKIEQSFSQLQEALKREVNFTRDVSHEIRTPLSVIKNIMSNNQQAQQITSDEYVQIYRANYELEKITHTLLALAQNESNQLSPVNLTELIENTLLQHFELNNSEKGQALEIDLKVAEDVIQTVNQNLVQILLNNVLSNIVQYANEPKVLLTLTQSGMTFKNHTSELVPNQPLQQGVKGFSSTGIGQGLNLIERICQLNYWTLKADYQSGIFKLDIVFKNSYY